MCLAATAVLLSGQYGQFRRPEIRSLHEPERATYHNRYGQEMRKKLAELQANDDAADEVQANDIELQANSAKPRANIAVEKA